mgnify:CR=1 FL=1
MGLEDNYGKIPLRRIFRPFLEAVCDTADGHDHDGTNSKALSPSAVIANDAISTVKIQDNAVTADKIAANAVTGAKILDEAVTGAKIPAQTITTTHLADTNVTAAKIGAGAVTATKIGAGAVIAEKIGADAVIEAKIQNGAVTADKIGTDAVIEAKIQNGAVTENKIGAAAVTAGKIAADAVITAKILDANVTADKIAAGAVTAVKLNADVAGDGLALNGGTNALEITVDDSTIETDSDILRVKGLGIDTAQIAAGAVTVAKIETSILKGVRDFPVSFETDETTTLKVYFPYKVTINKIRAFATKAIAGTDDATITCGNETGASTAGVITFTASDALATEKAVEPSDNNVVAAGEYYYLTTAKTTPGGKALVSLEYTRTA